VSYPFFEIERRLSFEGDNLNRFANLLDVQKENVFSFSNALGAKRGVVNDFVFSIQMRKIVVAKAIAVATLRRTTTACLCSFPFCGRFEDSIFVKRDALNSIASVPIYILCRVSFIK